MKGFPKGVVYYMYKILHNGMNLEYVASIVEVNKYIEKELEPYKNLRPKLKYNYEFGNAIFLCYEYYTKYCEMFLIEKED